MPTKGSGTFLPGTFGVSAQLFRIGGTGTPSDPYFGYIFVEHINVAGALAYTDSIDYPRGPYTWFRFKNWRICLTGDCAGIYVHPSIIVQDTPAAWYCPLSEPWLVTRNTQDETVRDCGVDLLVNDPYVDQIAPGIVDPDITGRLAITHHFSAVPAANIEFRAIITCEWGDKE